MATYVNALSPTPIADAGQRFAADLTFETGCRGMREAHGKDSDFVRLDADSPVLFSPAHVAAEINLPHGEIVRSTMAHWAEASIFVTYRAGHRHKGAALGALRLAELGRPIEIMDCCMAGRLGQGYNLVSDEAW